MGLEIDSGKLSARKTVPRGIELSSICDSAGFLALCGRLQNDRPSCDYLRIYAKEGKIQKFANKDPSKPWPHHAKWAFDTLNQTASSKTSIGFYAQSYKTGQTCWGGLDFDLHHVTKKRDPAIVETYREALNAFQSLTSRYPSAVVIFEESGRGFHVILIVDAPIPVSTMHHNMKAVCGQGTKAEILPSPRISNYGKPLRAPGTWNPEVDRVSLILGVAGPHVDISGKHYWLAGLHTKLPERGFFLSLFFRVTKGEQETAPANWSAPGGISEIRDVRQIWDDSKDQYFIEKPKTRHLSLLNLVGELSYQYPRDVVLRFAEFQFETKTVSTIATMQQHILEAEIAYDGMVKQWLEQARSSEALFHNRLRTQARQAAFRILHNFNKYAEERGDEEFFVSQKVLAERLQISKRGAAQILKFFREEEVIKLTRNETVARSRRYCWLLG
jgi:ribosomal protein S25